MSRKRNSSRSAILNKIRVRRYRLKHNLSSVGVMQQNQISENQTNKSPNTGYIDMCLQDMLRSWAINHNVATRAINDLLKVLIDYGKLKTLIFIEMILYLS